MDDIEIGFLSMSKSWLARKRIKGKSGGGGEKMKGKTPNDLAFERTWHNLLIVRR